MDYKYIVFWDNHSVYKATEISNNIKSAVIDGTAIVVNIKTMEQMNSIRYGCTKSNGGAFLGWEEVGEI